MFNLRSKSKLKKLLKGARYTPGKYIDNLGNIFHFPDQQSFAWTYIELFEKQIYFFKMRDKKEDPLIIDCGANIGISIIYFKTIFPNCKIIAFEPDPFLFSYLERNITINKLKGVQLFQKAVWDKETKIEFFQEKSDSGRLSLNNNLDIKKSNLIRVDSCLLSKFITSKIDFLKIDIEGAEWPVMKEIEEKIKSVERIFVESHSFSGEKQDVHKILELLAENNFRYYITEGAVTTPNPFLIKNHYLNMDLQINIHAFRE